MFGLAPFVSYFPMKAIAENGVMPTKKIIKENSDIIAGDDNKLLASHDVTFIIVRWKKAKKIGRKRNEFQDKQTWIYLVQGNWILLVIPSSATNLHSYINSQKGNHFPTFPPKFIHLLSMFKNFINFPSENWKKWKRRFSASVIFCFSRQDEWLDPKKFDIKLNKKSLNIYNFQCLDYFVQTHHQSSFSQEWDNFDGTHEREGAIN